ncbi:MAG: stage V sporulation protein AD [Ruminococcaceae bacterium]|nr:stage V sporulation protein AD [Oscillospiraceae bacterium]
MKNKPCILHKRVFIISSASVVGKKEKSGPLGHLFDLGGDDRFGKNSWEKAEAEMQRLSLGIALNKCGLKDENIDAMFAGDLINQCISSSYGLSNYKIPFLGLFGACSTCAEGMLMSAIYTSLVFDRCAAITSSHYCAAERQFRYPLEYGGQRPPTAQWTVTGSASFIISSLPRDIRRCSAEYIPEIVDVMPGCIVDKGLNDANNMGAAMAPSAADTLERYFSSGISPDDFDMIITGDLGYEGTGILEDLLLSKNIDITKNHVDCGNMIYDESSDTHAGGSGCGCSAVVMSADILENIKTGTVRNILFLGTGALMNTMSINQKQTIPGIAHLVHIKAAKKSDIIIDDMEEK